MDWYGATLIPLAGGYSGETFLVGDDSAEQVVLRIYRRDPDRALVDASLLRLVRGILPVPEVVDVRPARGDEPALLVTSKLAGVPLDHALREGASELDLTRLGRSLGALLARLSGIPFLDFGMFAGAELHVGRMTAQTMSTDLAAFVRHQRDSGRIAAWRDEDYAALEALIERAGDLTDDVAAAGPDRRVLVHSDFNAKNLLVDPATSGVTGVLDWEFAHAGSPYADLGNLTRFDRHPDLVTATLKTLREQAPPLADNALDLGRAADLWALVELAGRVPSNPVCDLATELLLAEARSGDLQAWPWAGHRVDPKGAKPVL